MGGRAEEMSVQVRRDRHTIRNLENEVSLLRAQLTDQPVGWQAPAAAPPQGSPPAEGAVGQVGGPAVPAPPPEVSGDAVYGDVEIVYEGDAARQSAARPRIQLHETTRTAQGLTSSDEELAPPPPPDLGSERLPVLSGRIPKVDEQLRSARSAPSSGTSAAPRAASDPTQAARAEPRAIPRSAALAGGPASAPAPAASASVPASSSVRRPAAGPAVAMTLPAPAPSPSLARPSTPRSEQVIAYRRAIATLRRGEYQRAAQALRAFLDRYPHHYLSDNVQYFLAESYYRRELYKVALGEYETVVKRYWRGNKLPSAMLKIALCHAALGRPEDSRASMQRLVDRFPHTRAAELARAKLEELDRP